MKKIIHKIMSHPDLLASPPIFIDIGASGKTHNSWSKLAKYAICICFDADLRDFSTEQTKSDYKKLILINKIVSDSSGIKDFYLTRNPHCSSTLNTDIESLSDWYFKNLFIVDKKVKIEAITINEVLASLNINRVDWFKTDSQGTDLRIFKAIHKPIRKRILSAEFEPGIIDAYQGEDKLYSIFEYMNKDYFIDNISFKGSIRVSPSIVSKNFSWIHNTKIDITSKINKASKLWAEVQYLNAVKDKEVFSHRDILLYCAILIIKKQYLFCFEICDFYEKKFNDELFEKIKIHCRYKINMSIFKLAYKLPKITYQRMKSYVFSH